MSLAEYDKLIEAVQIKDLLSGGKTVVFDFSTPVHEVNQYGYKTPNLTSFKVLNPDEAFSKIERRIHEITQKNEQLNIALQAFADKQDKEWSDKQIKKPKYTWVDFIAYVVSIGLVYLFIQGLLEILKIAI